MNKIELGYKPERINMTRSEIKETLATSKKYIKEDKLPFTVIDKADLSDTVVEDLIHRLR